VFPGHSAAFHPTAKTNEFRPNLTKSTVASGPSQFGNHLEILNGSNIARKLAGCLRQQDRLRRTGKQPSKQPVREAILFGHWPIKGTQ